MKLKIDVISTISKKIISKDMFDYIKSPSLYEIYKQHKTRANQINFTNSKAFICGIKKHIS